MSSVVADYTFKSVFLTFYIIQAGPSKHRGARDNLPPPLFSLSMGLGALATC